MKSALIKIGLIILLAAVLFAVTFERQPKDVPLSEIEEAFETELEEGKMERYGDMKLRREFSLLSEDFAETVYYGQSDTMSVGVFLVLKCVPGAGTKAARQAVDDYLAAQKEAFEGYGASQTALINAAVIYEKGDYVALFVSERAAEWYEKLITLLEGKSWFSRV